MINIQSLVSIERVIFHSPMKCKTNKQKPQTKGLSSVTSYLLVFKGVGDVPALKVSANLFDSQINTDEN